MTEGGAGITERGACARLRAHLRQPRAPLFRHPHIHLRQPRAHPASPAQEEGPSYPRSAAGISPSTAPKPFPPLNPLRAHIRHLRARREPSYPRSAAGISPSTAPKPLPASPPRAPLPATPRAPFRRPCAPFRHSCAGRNLRSRRGLFHPPTSGGGAEAALVLVTSRYPRRGAGMTELWGAGMTELWSAGMTERERGCDGALECGCDGRAGRGCGGEGGAKATLAGRRCAGARRGLGGRLGSCLRRNDGRGRRNDGGGRGVGVAGAGLGCWWQRDTRGERGYDGSSYARV